MIHFEKLPRLCFEMMSKIFNSHIGVRSVDKYFLSWIGEAGASPSCGKIFHVSSEFFIRNISSKKMDISVDIPFLLKNKLI